MNFSWTDAALLGLVQGLTEFLPVSSTAHLRILGALLGDGADPGAAFTAITQLGTELAVVIYFRGDITRIAVAWLRSISLWQNARPPLSADARIGWLILIGTLPIAVLGLLLKDAIEGALRNLYVTASMLIVFGLVLGFADRCGAKQKPITALGWQHGLWLGFAQALALIPGVSRSGSTISAGLLLGYTREAAARYSFLLALPAVTASGLYQLAKTWGQPGAVAAGPTALATLISFVVGYAVIFAFLRLISRRSFLPFVWYRLALGGVLLVLLSSGQMAAS